MYTKKHLMILGQIFNEIRVNYKGVMLEMKIESRLAQIGSIQEPVTGAVSFPIYQATAFRHPKLGQSTGFDYARTKSPTRNSAGRSGSTAWNPVMPGLPAAQEWPRCKRFLLCSVKGII